MTSTASLDSWSRIPLNKLPPESRGKQYVSVQAVVSGVFDLEKPILLSPNPGNIFIQTDKPIYTPDNRVNYKIFCTDHNMQPISQSVIIQIQNPDGIIINQNTVMPSNGVISNNYLIPELVIFGTWKIVARFQDKVQAEYTAGFEVREYVLPAFNVELTTEQNYFHYKAEKLTILITAKHLFGEPVDGYAVVLFGIYKDSMKAIHGSLQKVQLDDGVGEAVLSKDVLTKEISNTDELIGASIYVNVTVFSSGGDYVQQQKTGIKIESSPYTIEFVRTPSYFKPGIPFKFGVYVTNPDKTPAAQIKVICTTCKNSGVSGSTSPEGLAFLNINPDISDSQLAIGVSTDDKNLDKNQQAKAQMSASAYTPLLSLKNFLHIDVKTTVITDHVDVTLMIRIDPIMNKDAVKYVTVLVVSKGKILQTIIQKKSPGTEIIALRIDVTRNMLPSFRLVGYYYLQMEGNVFDIVSDSVWVHMKRTCIGTLNVKSKTDQVKPYSPQQIVELILSGDNGAQVELGIIDKAVFVLNNKNKLTQNKIWDTVEQSDIACTAGSGANFLGVFHDAGLDFTASNRAETPSRKDIPCDPEKPVRSKRAIEMLEAKQKKVNGSPDHLKSCCAAGWQKSPMGLSCIKRKEHVNMEKECVDLFFECCELAEELRRKYEEDPELGKSNEEECIECVSDNVKVRTNFKESWHWQRITLSEGSSKDGIAEKLLQLFFPDSITTWVLQAISIHKDKGVCVADPFEMVVFQSFFVDLRLPYSVVKNEQVQIRAVIYNYSDKDIQVVITFPFKENVCSLANKHKSYQQTVSVPKKKSRVVKYVIIPLKEGNVEIEVRADVKGELVSDRVKKNLNVMPEGKVKRIKTFSHLLNPGGRSLVIPITAPALERMVPGSIAENFISIQGDLLGETLLGTLDDTYLGRLIYVPSGCPEQNMVHITPNVIVTRYLDSTMKWKVIGAEKRKRAIENIKTGYSTQLSHRLADHSFTGTTWLTAYVVKIFALASSLMHIDETMLCNAASWLTTRQKNSGWFEERGKVYARSMQGGFVGAENDASLTAFVVIALHEVDKKCSIPAITNALRRAEKYLENQLPILKQTYSVVISSYALSLVGNLKGSDIIDRFVSKDGSYWPVDNDDTSLFTVEATGYALLQKLKLKKYDQARQIAEWLVGRREFGGGYSSTQATVVAMEALAQFEMNIPKDDTINLDIQISVEGRASPVPYTITKDDAYVQRTSKDWSYLHNMVASNLPQNTG
ncbi:complement C3 [Bombina bombina]|uniref:complement C3 n=1 Tax=Bombina bombina TaxID=8345 RepID=UPI00235B1F8F|nr:complement C3 [Bombina bombina]